MMVVMIFFLLVFVRVVMIVMILVMPMRFVVILVMAVTIVAMIRYIGPNKCVRKLLDSKVVQQLLHLRICTVAPADTHQYISRDRDSEHEGQGLRASGFLLRVP